jgi:hypothetical protein
VSNPRRVVVMLLAVALAILALLFFLVALSGEEEHPCIKLGNQVLGGDCPTSKGIENHHERRHR